MLANLIRSTSYRTNMTDFIEDCADVTNTAGSIELFEMIVGVLTTCHVQYT